MTEPQTKRKGTADMVFLIDATGSMQPFIDALKTSVNQFIDYLVSKTGGQMPLQDWRARVVGYRDVESDGAEWLVEKPFTRDASELRQHLAALEAKGGGDDPESLLDALFKVCEYGETDTGNEDAGKWRTRREAARIVIIFTDADYKPAMAIPEAGGGGFDDIANRVMDKRIMLFLYAPGLPSYNSFSEIDRTTHFPTEGAGLSDLVGRPENFQKQLEALARTISQSAPVQQVAP